MRNTRRLSEAIGGYVVLYAILFARSVSAAINAGNVANLAGIVGSLVNDVKNVQAGLGDSYEPYSIGNEAADQPGSNKGFIGGALSGIVLGTEDISGTINQIASCNPDDKGLCCLMPNYCVTNADCFADKLTTNVLDLLKAVPTCKCKKGFQGDGRTQGTGCVNIDECATGEALCEDICEDRSPGYSCGCSTGFTLNANGYGCDDIDECALGISGCEQACENTRGGYICHCESGFTLDDNGHSCSDIDECAIMAELVAAKSDGELSELALAAKPDLAICEYPELCANFPGAYGCSCPAGFKVDPNSATSCVDVDECAAGVTDPTTGELLLSPKDSPNGQLCVSSSDGTKAAFGPSQQCLNLPGSFICQCAPGFRPVKGGSYDSAFAERLLGIGLALDPLNVHVADTEVQRELYARAAVNALVLDCEDIDECAENPSVCGGAECTNTIGSYSCECAQGHEFSTTSGVCVDIDECALMASGASDAELQAAGVVVPCDTAAGEQCVNLEGTYACRCGEGFKQIRGPESKMSMEGKEPLKCVDINECEDPAVNQCVHGCSNRTPGYTCTCPTGYEAGGPTFQQCVDLDECALGFCAPGATCINLPGTYLCSCDRNQVAGKATTTDPNKSLPTDLRRWLLKAQEMGAAIDAATTPETFASALSAWNSVVAANSTILTKLQELLSSSGGCTHEGMCALLEAEIADLCPGDSQCVDFASGFYCGCPEGYQLSNDNAAASLMAQVESAGGSTPTQAPSPSTIAGSILGSLFGGGTGLFGRRLQASVSRAGATKPAPADATALLTPDEVALATEIGLIQVTADSAELTVPAWVVRGVDYENFKLSGGLYADAVCRDIDECTQGIRASGELGKVCPANAPCCANRAGSWNCSAKRTLLLGGANCPSGTINLSTYA